MSGGARELVVLGTASRLPTRARNHHALLLRFDDQLVLMDPGEGTQRQLALAHRSTAGLTAICLTHFHGDHCLGLPGVLARRGLEHPTGAPVDVWFPAERADVLGHLLASTETYAPLPGTPRAVDREGEVGRLGALRLVARRLDHPVPTIGWRIEEPDTWHVDPRRAEALGVRGPAIGRLVQNGQVRLRDGRTVGRQEVATRRRGTVVAFVFDTRWCDGALALADGADLLVCESTFAAGEEAMAHEYGHLTSVQAARLAAEAGARRLVLTHYSQRHPDESVLRAQAAAHHPDVVAAHDLQVIPIPHDRHDRTALQTELDEASEP